MPDDPPPRPETLCTRHPEPPASATTPLVPPLSPSVVYRFEGLDQVDDVYEGRAPGFVYARDGHPNGAQLAARVAALEGAESALACASGMAAEAAVLLSVLDGGGHVALSEGVYGKTAALIGRELARFGVDHSRFDAARPETLRDAINPRTRLAFAETLSNPLVRLADIPGLAEVARAAGVPLLIDHTFAPLLCRPVALGADAVVHSGTKLIGGHSDLTIGLLAGSESIVAGARRVASAFGLTANPYECWLTLRGLVSLGVRSARACANALEISGRLAAHPKVAAVHYPGLPTHPDHDRARRLLDGGFGAIAAIDLGSRARADAFIRGLRHIPFAPSLGDAATTLSHPATTSHRGQGPEPWARQGITPGLVRLSFGLEDPGDLWDDLRRALDAT